MTSPRGRVRRNAGEWSRPFDGLDAATLIAATALGLVMSNDIHGSYTSTMFDGGRHNPHGFRLWRPVAVPLFASWTLALIPLRLRRRDARPRRLARRPGFAACLVVALMAFRALVDQGVWIALHHRQWGFPLVWFGLENMLTAFPSQFVYVSDATGFVVAAAWLALGFGRWWRPEPRWIDRAGRVLGGYWIAMFVVGTYEGLAS